MSFQPGDMNQILRERGAGRGDFGAPPGSLSGSPVAAKMSAVRWQRKSPNVDAREPSPFEIERNQNPEQFKLWGERFLTTSAAAEFQAPPMAPSESSSGAA